MIRPTPPKNDNLCNFFFFFTEELHSNGSENLTFAANLTSNGNDQDSYDSKRKMRTCWKGKPLSTGTIFIYFSSRKFFSSTRHKCPRSNGDWQDWSWWNWSIFGWKWSQRGNPHRSAFLSRRHGYCSCPVMFPLSFAHTSASKWHLLMWGIPIPLTNVVFSLCVLYTRLDNLPAILLYWCHYSTSITRYIRVFLSRPTQLLT